MITKQQMIDKIYECIADKTLSLGCFYFSEITRKKETYDGSVGTNYIRKVIGHPVMIGDVLDWIKENNKSYFNDNSDRYIFNKLYSILWNDYRKPIEDQSDECIAFIYNLIQGS